MSSPLFDAIGRRQADSPFARVQQMRREFEEFKASFKGDAHEEVNKLLQSGRMTQQQYNQLQQQAATLSGMLGR